jgi:hypothetical protein
MYYYVYTWQGAELLANAVPWVTIRWNPADLVEGWGVTNTELPWHQLQPEEGTVPSVGLCPRVLHPDHPTPSGDRYMGEWNNLHPNDLNPGWRKDALLKPEAPSHNVFPMVTNKGVAINRIATPVTEGRPNHQAPLSEGRSDQTPSLSTGGTVVEGERPQPRVPFTSEEENQSERSLSGHPLRPTILSPTSQSMSP